MKIVIEGREMAEKLAPLIILPHAIISIGEPEPRREEDTGPAKFGESKQRLGLLRLQFYDIDVDSITNAGYLLEIRKMQKEYGNGLFTDDQADQIVDFVENMRGKIEVLLCHCEAGISRSSGMAAAIMRILTGSDDEVFNNPKYIPNRFVYRKILNAWERRQK